MVSKVSPLAWNMPIVDDKGNPTPYFVRQLERLLAEKAVTDTLAEGAVPGARQVIAGTGLSGGGALTADVTLNVDTTAEAERIRDVIGTALVAGTNITITVNDGGDTITLAASGGGGGSYTRYVVATAGDNFITVNLGSDGGRLYHVALHGNQASGGDAAIRVYLLDSGTPITAASSYKTNTGNSQAEIALGTSGNAREMSAAFHLSNLNQAVGTRAVIVGTTMVCNNAGVISQATLAAWPNSITAAYNGFQLKTSAGNLDNFEVFVRKIY